MALAGIIPPQSPMVSDGPIFSKSSSASGRLSTQSGYRFGHRSLNSFFARHNPHPKRCTYITGLLGLPIPMVNDDFPLPPARTPLFPPNSYNDELIHTLRLPVSAINVNSHRKPIDTITGLQYFTRLRNFSVKEKAIPRLGLVPVTENWREQLRNLTEDTFLPFMSNGSPQPVQSAPANNTERKTAKPLYSTSTGRLIPPPSRALNRRTPKTGGQRSIPAAALAEFEHIAAAPDLEAVVFGMLSQILQTEDFNAVQSWLVSASDRERGLVSDLIRSAVANRDEYYTVFPTGEAVDHAPVDVRSDLKLPPIPEQPNATMNFDRLVIEDTQDPPAVASQPPKNIYTISDTKPTTKEEPAAKVAVAPPTNTKLTKKPMEKRSKTKAKLKKTNAVLNPPGNNKNTWNPDKSYVVNNQD